MTLHREVLAVVHRPHMRLLIGSWACLLTMIALLVFSELVGCGPADQCRSRRSAGPGRVGTD